MDIGETEKPAERLAAHELFINMELSCIWKVVPVSELELHHVSDLSMLWIVA